MDQEGTDFREFDRRVDEQTAPTRNGLVETGPSPFLPAPHRETEYDRLLRDMTGCAWGGCVIGVSGAMPQGRWEGNQLNYDHLGCPNSSVFIPTVWTYPSPTDASGTTPQWQWTYSYPPAEPIARVELRCGKLILVVAGVVLAVEGDMCRDGGYVEARWDRAMLGQVAERINTQAPYARQGNHGLKEGGAT